MKWCKSILKFCMFKKGFQRFHNKFTKCGVFHCVYDNKQMDGKGPQVMFCMFCYNNSIDVILEYNHYL